MTIPSMARSTMVPVQDILDRDGGPAIPPVLREEAPRSLGTGDIGVERYTSREFLELEYEKLWSRVWQWAATEDEIPEVGDHTVYEIGDRNVIVVRSEPDRIQAFYNSCQHRGRLLADAPGSTNAFVCPFHAWTYGLDGSLKSLPCEWDFPQVQADRKRFGLREVRCERYGGFVFVNFDDDAAPLLESLDVVPEHFKHFPLDHRFAIANVRKIVPINWKACMEAFLESYHVIATHIQALDFTGDANTQYDIWDTSSRLITVTGVPSPHLPEGSTEADVFAVAAAAFAPPGAEIPPLPEGVTARSVLAAMTRQMLTAQLGLDLSKTSDTEVIDSIEYFVFPNWLPWAGVAQGLQYRFRPNGMDPDSCIFDVKLMLPYNPEGPRPPSAPLRELKYEESFTAVPELGLFGEIFDQDFGNMAALQKGMKTHGKAGLTFSDYQEARIRHFHQVLDKWLEL
ncbi:aromatic ring-hydroxylating dioxygenase subunit alpha [Pseudonocardia eucalypti]|uniref:Aromatic ring-hydroxylating dioxygenase subunit alpha n=1 Tax=Pseudonocardia eucalypti TaxID=648755 RepID=A0ABP9QQI3_9PSEU|nr:phenylpropionate dioxygenase-like ring-hydroxylating dioxygenase large terminal subunit [Pseudonocardia eucalypti]